MPVTQARRIFRTIGDCFPLTASGSSRKETLLAIHSPPLPLALGQHAIVDGTRRKQRPIQIGILRRRDRK